MQIGDRGEVRLVDIGRHRAGFPHKINLLPVFVNARQLHVIVIVLIRDEAGLLIICRRRECGKMQAQTDPVGWQVAEQTVAAGVVALPQISDIRWNPQHAGRNIVLHHRAVGLLRVPRRADGGARQEIPAGCQQACPV